MCARRVKNEEVYETDDIIIGFGEVPAIRTAEGLRWILPDRQHTACRRKATAVAERLDRMIRANVPRYQRSLIW